MKNKNLINLKKIIFCCLLVLTMYSCRSSSKISNGAYSDISLNVDSKQYNIERLDEITKEEKAIFGIPMGKKLAKTSGLVVRFNGVNLSAGGKILPIISMVAISTVGGIALSQALGFKKETVFNGWSTSTVYTDEPKLPYAIGILIATPIAGLINNQIWSGALSRAAWQANSQLLADNDDIDVFLNPKYTFETRKGFFTQTAKIRFRVMGAKILTDSDKK
jgi:hypothetical protein